MVSILEPTETKALQMCAQFFRKGGQHQSAKDVYIKLQDHRSLIQLLVELGRWDEAFLLLKTHPELKDEVYLPRAKVWHTLPSAPRTWVQTVWPCCPMPALPPGHQQLLLAHSELRAGRPCADPVGPLSLIAVACSQ